MKNEAVREAGRWAEVPGFVFGRLPAETPHEVRFEHTVRWVVRGKGVFSGSAAG